MRGEGRGEPFEVVPKRIFEFGTADLGAGGNATAASIVNVAGCAAVLFVLWIFVRRRFRRSRATTRKVDFLLGSGLKL